MVDFMEGIETGRDGVGPAGGSANALRLFVLKKELLYDV